MILRLRQLCCHPYLILVSTLSTGTRQITDSHFFHWQSLTEEHEDPALLVGNVAEKELSRARRAMGAAWVAEVGLVVTYSWVASLYFLFRLRQGVT